MTITSCRRCGLMRADVLVAAFVLLIGAGLLTPAIARVQTRSARQRSANHLQKIGEGLQKYHTTFGFFPSNGGPPPETVTAPDVRTRYPNGEVFRWGYGDPKRTGRLQTGSYAYAILPFVGEEAAFRKQSEDCADNWGSPDAAGVHFLFADNHVRLLSYKTPAKLMWELMTPNVDEDADCEQYIVP